MIPALLEIWRLKRRLLIVVAVLLVMVIGIRVFRVVYLDAALATARATWNDKRNKVALAGRTDVTASYNQGKLDLETLKKRIAEKRQFPRILGSIIDTAAASGVATGAMNYKPQFIKDQNTLAYGITMSVAGSYAAVKSFLSDLQKSRELVVLEGVSFSNPDLYQEHVILELHLTVYLREGA